MMNSNNPTYRDMLESIIFSRNFSLSQPSSTDRILDPYPIDSYPPILRNVITSLAIDTNIPEEMIGSAVLAAVSLALQPLIEVLSPHSNDPEPCSLYMLILALSGEGKTTLYKRIMKPFYLFFDEMKTEHENKIAEYSKAHKRWNIKRKALESAFKQAIKKGEDAEIEGIHLDEHFDAEPVKPIKLNFLYEDSTPKAIIEGLNEYPYGGIFSDEAITFFKGYTRTNLGLFNRTWGGDAYIYQRPKEDDIEIRANLTLLLMVQPEIFMTYLKKKGDEAISSGFLSRFLITHTASTIGRRNSNLNHEQSDKYLNCFYDEITIRLEKQKRISYSNLPAKTTLFLSEDAKKLFSTKYIEFQSKMKELQPWAHIREFASKAGSNALRVAAMFHTMGNSDNEINYKTLQNAYTLVEWHVNQAQKLFYPLSANYQFEQDVLDLFAWIKFHFATPSGELTCLNAMTGETIERKQLPFDPFPKRDIETHGPNRLRRIERLEPALRQLIYLGLIMIVQIPLSKAEYIARNDSQGYGQSYPHGLINIKYNKIYDKFNTTPLLIPINPLELLW